jgi:glycosyltransferase involved in cell wall biosynthesis
MAARSLTIAVVKPDAGIIGGFERVTQRVVRWLRSEGHVVRVLTVRTDTPLDAVTGKFPTTDLARTAPEFVTHLAQLAAFRRLTLSWADVVISTQPPSQAISHPRHLALFYHHDRIFYDLSERFIESGAARDGEIHRELSTLVQQLDRPGMDGVTQFLVPSATVRQRLKRFNGVDPVLPFHAAVAHGPARASSADAPRSHILCVGRHEFPKRAELFVAAAHQVPEVKAICVGTGNRLAFAQRIDRHLDRGETLDPEALWLRPPNGDLPFLGRPGAGHVEFLHLALSRQLDQLYRQAYCVVAPALDEDYGLTAIEAMAWGTPVVVCDDGGSLAEIVSESGAGEVVGKSHKDIGDAIRRIVYDRDRAAKMGERGRAAVQHRFTWPRAFDQLQTALSRVADG